MEVDMSLGKCWEKTTRASSSPSRMRRRVLATALLLGLGAGAFAIVTDLTLVGALHDPVAVHVDQFELLGLVQGGEGEEAFEEAFEKGDDLFAARFNALDGVGANVGQGQRFTRVPRADLAGPGEWASHVPARATGPNAESCAACHGTPAEDGSGPASANVHRDPTHRGVLARFIARNTPHLFAAGAVQRLAEEMTAELHEIREDALRTVCESGDPLTVPLHSKGVSYGYLTVKRVGTEPCTTVVDTST